MIIANLLPKELSSKKTYVKPEIKLLVVVNDLMGGPTGFRHDNQDGYFYS